MTQLEIIDAKDRFAELLALARSGEEIVLADAGRPVAKLRLVEEAVSQTAAIEPEWKKAWRQAAGMWKDRDDIPELMEQLRREWNRVEPPAEPLE